MQKLLNKNILILSLVSLCAFLLRVPGVFNDLPLFLSMDENSFFGSVDGLRFDSSLNRFDWPHTSFYIHRFFHFFVYSFRVVLQNFGLKEASESIFPLLWDVPSIFYATSRFVQVLFASLTVVPIYLSSRLLFKNKILWFLPAILFALIPYNIIDASKGVLDTEVTFWISFFVYYVLLLSKNASLKNFFLAGVFMGLAFGTKYYAAFYVLVFLVGLFYSVNSKKLTNFVRVLFSRNYIIGYLCSALGFFSAYLSFNFQVITDFDLFWSKEFGKGFLFQFDNVKSLPWNEFPEILYKVSFFQPLVDYGVVIFLLFFISVILFVFFSSYRNKTTYFFVPLILFSYLYLSTKSRNPSHYFVMLYPAAVFIVSDFILRFSNFLSNLYLATKNKKIKTSYFLIPLLLVVIIFTGFKALENAYKLSRKDTRNIAFNWFQEEADESLKVYYYGDDLDRVPFYDLSEKKITRLDNVQINVAEYPYYLVIGIDNVDYESLVINMSHSDVSGWTSKFLTISDLEIYIDNTNRFGPPIYIFKVKEALIR